MHLEKMFAGAYSVLRHHISDHTYANIAGVVSADKALHGKQNLAYGRLHSKR